MVKRSSRSARRAAVKTPAGFDPNCRVAPKRKVPSATRGASRWIRSGASEIHGRGVYAGADIPDGTRVIQYLGERITKAEARRREARRLIEQRNGGEGCVTIFNLGPRHDLDGRGVRNIARLINHSCVPNCRAEQIRGQIWIVARRDISTGEELTFDYGYALADWSLHPCRCGAKKCPGYIVGSHARWRLRRFLRHSRRSSASLGAA